MQRAEGLPPFHVAYDEGLKVGYKWYDAEKKAVLFPFGYGLSYTSYGYSGLTVTQGKTVEATFTVANTGGRAGAEVAEVYASLRQSRATSEAFGGLEQGYSSNAGEKKTVTVEIDPKYFSIFDEEKDGWILVPGEYTILVGGSSQDLPLRATFSVK